MKKIYFFCFLMTSTVIMSAQTNCDDANYYLVSAYSHVKKSYESNNISHLKYSANRSVESIKLYKEALGDCHCKAAFDLANKSMDLLVKVESAETFEDGRFYVKRARELSQESVVEIDRCSSSVDTESADDSNDVAIAEDTNQNGNDELNALKNEQLKLQQQQEALKLKALQIKEKLAQQKEKEIAAEKKALVLTYQNTVATNIETYNKTLKACNCSDASIQAMNAPSDISERNLEDIKAHYINDLKALATDYLSKLNSCN